MLATLFIFLVAVQFALTNLHNPQVPSCGKQITIDGKPPQVDIQYLSKKPPSNITCTWILNVLNEAYLKAAEFYLDHEDSFSVFDVTSKNDKNTSSESDDVTKEDPLFGPFRGRQGAFVIALTTGVYKLILKTSLGNYPRTFALSAFNSCSSSGVYNIPNVQSPGSGISPFYQPGEGSFTCTITISGQGVKQRPEFLSVSFADYNVSAGQISLGNNIYNFVETVPPLLLLLKSIAQFNLTIDRRIPNQNVIFDFDLASEGCSGVINLTSSHPTSSISLNISSEAAWLPLTCQWMVQGPPSSHIYLRAESLSLRDQQDNLFISAPKNYGFEPILLTSASKSLTQVENLEIPGNHLLVKYMSTRPRKGTSVHLSLSIHERDQSTHENEGFLILNDSTDSSFKLRVKEDELIHLSWSEAIPNGAVVSIHKNLELNPYLELDSSFATSFVTLPFDQVLVAGLNFPRGQWKLSFQGQSRDICNQVKSEDRARFQTGKICDELCSWIVPPQSNEGSFELTFPEVRLAPTDNITLFYPILGNSKSTVFSSVKSIPAISIPSTSGVHLVLKRKCSTTPSKLKALVQLKPSCHKTRTIEEGESIQMESPNYPDAYPLNANCSWHLSSPAHFLSVRFGQVSLSHSSHSLIIKDARKTVSIHGTSDGRFSVLPGDLILEPPVSLQFQTPLAALPPGSGFLLTALAYDCGGVEVVQKGYLTLPPESQFCLWSISVQGAAGTKTQLLLSVHLDSRQFLKIYDGDSLRYNALNVDSNGNASSSGPNVIVVYRAQRPMPSTRLLQYSTKVCDLNDLCGNGMCMEKEWRCNRLNDCGDYSDEKDCAVDQTSASPCDTSSSLQATVINLPAGTPPLSSRGTSQYSSARTILDSSSPASYTEGTSQYSSTRTSSGSSSPASHTEGGLENSSTITSSTEGDTRPSTSISSTEAHSVPTSTKQHSTTSHGVYSEETATSECVSHTVLALSVMGAMMVGLVSGMLVFFVYLKQKRKGKTWLALQSSNTQLTTGDNVSL